MKSGTTKAADVNAAERQRAAGWLCVLTAAATAGATKRVVVLQRLPRHQPFAQLFRSTRRVASRFECFAAQQSDVW
jgi:hypothetical protein